MNDVPMSDLESQLRALMNIAVSKPPRRLDAQLVRRRAVRRRAATLVAGVTATALVLGIGLAVAVAATGQVRRAPASHASPPAGAPRFYLEQSSVSGMAMVRLTATGAITGTVACPAQPGRVFLSSIVPANDQKFLMVCQRATGPGLVPVTGSRIYRFRLTSSGRVDGYSLVRGGLLHGLRVVGDIAVTPDGSEVAVSVAPGTAGGWPKVPEVIVIDTRTGAHAVWHGVPLVPGKISYPIVDISLTANGQELAYLTVPRCVKGKNAPPCHAKGGEEMRAVSHPASGGQLGSSRLLVRQSSLMRLAVGYINGAMISSDGRTVILAEMDWPFGYITIARASVATGKQVGVVFREHTGDGFSYQLFSSDPSRRFFILIAGPSRSSINGAIGDGRLFRLKPAGDDVNLEAW